MYVEEQSHYNYNAKLFPPLNDAKWRDEKMKKETSSHFTEGSHSHRDQVCLTLQLSLTEREEKKQNNNNKNENSGLL